MKKDGVVINDKGFVTRLRVFPLGKSDRIELGKGFYMVRLSYEQIDTVSVGYKTKDNGRTFSPA
jgi:hypothetical protein